MDYSVRAIATQGTQLAARPKEVVVLGLETHPCARRIV